MNSFKKEYSRKFFKLKLWQFEKKKINKRDKVKEKKLIKETKKVKENKLIKETKKVKEKKRK